MAYTAITDIITPEVLADQISAKFPDRLVLGETNLVEVDSTFPLGSPGTIFKLPFWKRIGAFGALTEGTAMTPGKIQTGAEYAVVQRAGLALEVLDTAELVSKADPVGEIADQFARRAAEYIDAALVAELVKSPNKFDQSGSGKTNTNGTVDQNAIVKAMLTLGDNFGKLQQGGAYICHSKQYGDLLQTGAIQNQYQSGMDVIKTGLIPTIMGLPVIVSDLVAPNYAGNAASIISTETTAPYASYIVGPGALALFYQRQVMVEFDRDILLTADVIASNVHFSAHLFGYDDQNGAVVAEQNKSIHVVQLFSN